MALSPLQATHLLTVI
ncbi:UNVERIFIED_CONTAM: hypothetical protein GTU68_015809 [Idotea baltica]|nr:hypothetical protein [Idotea baltica]